MALRGFFSYILSQNKSPNGIGLFPSVRERVHRVGIEEEEEEEGRDR